MDLFDSVTTIGARAFAGCAQLEALTLPDSLTTIGEGALDGLTGLKKLVIKCIPRSSRRRVRQYAQSERSDRRKRRYSGAYVAGSGVTALTLGAGVTEIGESAFAG